MSVQGAKQFFSIHNSPNLVIIFVLLVYLVTNFTHHNWTRDQGPDRGVIKWDVISYYSYLPAPFSEEPGRLHAGIIVATYDHNPLSEGQPESCHPSDD